MTIDWIDYTPSGPAQQVFSWGRVYFMAVSASDEAPAEPILTAESVPDVSFAQLIAGLSPDWSIGGLFLSSASSTATFTNSFALSIGPANAAPHISKPAATNKADLFFAILFSLLLPFDFFLFTLF
jgi:hypothetical protein